MKHKKALFIALFFGLGLTLSYAQESFTASGGEASGSGGSASYSIGQVFYINTEGVGGSASPGAQQPFEISVVQAVENDKNVDLLMAVYPNPVTDYLIFKSAGEVKPQFKAVLYDSNGRIIESKRITATEAQIGMKELKPATYYLKIITGDKEVKTFKIIKN